ncbi:hypothetical protein XcuCFBP2542_18180 [Xanthomonas cucurbitae]|uniref:Uncharacterized protein n=1 Tax=Xanthomonas cucurbitae TaxID=56453 RepID=A0A2S7DC81_9XANT|nr:hypothetical protein [Xanthomonas cucurbitae]PPU71399.1 hypothetical protein XcuCFBP2542_18180 [Xanthomonas cucurbitae]WDM80966.1 hypothetical protein K6980_07545 [Xanthomonas cucurbitae]WDM84657.1 hypothetical protein K6979_07545 [Xanthomonas cucurbitae]
MSLCKHPLSRGGYRVVAITRDQAYVPEAIVAYAVVTDAGTQITPDLSFDQARLWIDSLVENEGGERRDGLAEHKPMVRR